MEVFAVSIVAQSPGKCGYRTGLVRAANMDEAVGKFLRYLSEAEPEINVSAPSAILLTHEKLEAVRNGEHDVA